MFVCSCGINIAGVVDVAAVVRIRQDPALRHLCGEQPVHLLPGHPGQDGRGDQAEQGLNRVVVAACTPRTHEPLFQETMVGAGLNKYLFEMANIRNQDSWVHSATSPRRPPPRPRTWCAWPWPRPALLEPLKEVQLEVHPRPWSSAAGWPA